MNIVSLARIATAVSDALTSLSTGPAPSNEADAVTEDSRLSGTTFAEQEPDLVKEAGVTGRAVSGWAMAGSSLPD